MKEVHIPSDITNEEIALLEIVKQRMLQKLNDRQKFVFVYCIELGYDQYTTSRVLQVNETNVSRTMRQIRQILAPFKPKK